MTFRSCALAALLAAAGFAAQATEFRSSDIHPEDYPTVLAVRHMGETLAKALALAGTEAYRRGDFGNALRYWNKALEAVPADSDMAASVRSGIAEADQRRAASVGQQRQ